MNFTLHPFTPCPAFGLNGTLTRSHGCLHLTYRLNGPIDELVILDQRPAIRSDNLWQSTCLELFWGMTGDPSYWELNLAPNGAWNIYRFDGYRTGMREEQRIRSLESSLARQEQGLRLAVQIPLHALDLEGRPVECGAGVVLAHSSGLLSYWAPSHPAAKPDFHLRQGLRMAL